MSSYEDDRVRGDQIKDRLVAMRQQAARNSSVVGQGHEGYVEFLLAAILVELEEIRAALTAADS